MFKGALSIWGRDMLVLRRSIISELIAVVAYPLTLYLAFGFGLKGYITDVNGVPYALFIAPGLVSMTAVNAAFQESSWSMWFHRKVQRTIEEYRVTPVTVYDIVIGKIFSGFSQGAIKGAVVFIVILLMTPFSIDYSHLPMYLLVIALSSMTFSCLGTICGTMIDKPENIGRVESVVIVPLIFMAGIFFPLTSYPARILPLIRLLPTTAVFEGARDALLHGTVPAEYFINLFVSAAVVFVIAVYTFNRKMAE
jgi:lipooligosaccharide transport system permease protein